MELEQEAADRAAAFLLRQPVRVVTLQPLPRLLIAEPVVPAAQPLEHGRRLQRMPCRGAVILFSVHNLPPPNHASPATL